MPLGFRAWVRAAVPLPVAVDVSSDCDEGPKQRYKGHHRNLEKYTHTGHLRIAKSPVRNRAGSPEQTVGVCVITGVYEYGSFMNVPARLHT